MRLLQDLMLVACLLFVFNTANAANMSEPLSRLFGHLQGTLDKVAEGVSR